MGIMNACALCGGESAALIPCHNCNKLYYCSKDHQEKHWETHQDHCHPFLEASDPACGRYLVATRDLQAGELLFKEAPVALGPLASCRLICLGCHEFIKDDEIVRCPGCWWPLCSLTCATSKFHKDECPVLALDTRHIGQPPCQEDTVRYDIILSLRCVLLKSTNPSDWARVDDMASHAQRRVDNKDFTHITTVRYIHEVLNNDFDEDDIHHAHDAIVSNCFEWRNTSGVRLRGVYPLMARMNHSCRPNVTLCSDREGTMYVRTAFDLKCGEPLVITYVGTSSPYWERQIYTNDVHFFRCDCIRCEDPTELGLHYSSPKCESCRKQFLEPNTWLGKTSWECALCGAQETEANVRYQAEEWMAWFDGDDTFHKATNVCVRNIMGKVQEAFHEQHFVWEKAALKAVKALRADATDRGLAFRRDLYSRLLKLYDVLEPGMTRRRGVTLYELGVSEARLATTEMKSGKLTTYFYTRQLEEALAHLQEAKTILELEPPLSNERRWYTRASEAIDTITCEILKEGGKAEDLVLPPVTHAHPQESEKMSGDEGVCGVCGTAAKLRCGGCSNVFYCSRDHQRKHWAMHRDECRPVKQVECPGMGRYLIASRDLKAGQLVLNESPVVVGPAGTCFPVCLGCHTAIADVESFRCPECHWPMCSSECHRKDLHTKECSILAQDTKRVGPPIGPGVTARYDLILVLRCLLLRETNPTLWTRILALESHIDARREQQEPYHMAGVRFLTEVVESGFDADTVHRVRGLMITNCINIRGANGEHLRAIYPNIAMLNHSCVPNLTIRSDSNNSLYIRTSVAVKKGDTLVFSYTPPEETIWQRQFDFKNVYFFTCKCRRCEDPTELGSHYSSPRCPKCPEKYLEPRNGLDVPWECSECGEKKESQEIMNEAEQYTKDIDDRIGSLADVQSLMDEISHTFHTRHYVWVTAAQAALRTLKKDRSIESLKLQQDIWRRLMAVYQLFEPGLTRRRGVSLYQLSVIETMVAQSQYTAGELTSDSYAAALTRVIRQLESSVEILSLEPPNSTETHWKGRAVSQAAAVTDILEGLRKCCDSRQNGQNAAHVEVES